MLLSPWLLGFSEISVMKWSNVLCGLALIIMNAWVLSEKRPVPGPLPGKTKK